MASNSIVRPTANPLDVDLSDATPVSAEELAQIDLSDAKPVSPEELASIDLSDATPISAEQLIQENKTDLMGAALQGIKEEALPFLTTPEERAQVDTPQESLVALGTSLLTNIVAGAAASKAGAETGALIGTAVAPGVGTAVGATVGAATGLALYGIYSGFGQEKLRSEGEGQEYSILRGAAKAGLQVNPVLSSSSKFTKLARAAAQVVGEAAVEYSYTGKKQDAAIAGVMGVLGGMAIPKQALVADAVGGKEVERIITDALDGVDGLAVRTQQIKETLPKIDSTEALSNMEFKRFVLSQPGMGVSAASEGSINKAFDKLLPTLGEDSGTGKSALEGLVDLWHTKKAMTKAADQLVSESMKQLNPTKFNTEDLNKFSALFDDALFVGKRIDDKLGTNLEGAFAKYGEARERYNTVSHALLKQGTSAAEATRAAGLTNKDMGIALTGKTHLLTPDAIEKVNSEAGQEAIKAWRQVWDDTRDALVAHGVNVNYDANYLPMRALRGPTLASEIQGRALDIDKAIKKYGQPNLPRLQEMLKEIDPNTASKIEELIFLGKRVDVDVQQIGDLGKLREMALNGRSKLSEGQAVGAAFERTMIEIAENLRDFDVANNFTSYLATNLKGAITRDEVRQLALHRDMLDGLGMREASDWLSHRIGLMSGAMGAGDAMLSNLAGRYKYGAERLMSSELAAARRAGVAVDKVGDFMGMSSAMPYASFLGANVKSAIHQLVQPFAQSAPELGGAYGYKLMAKSVLSAISDKLNPSVRIGDTLDQYGLTSKFYNSDNLIDKTHLSRMKGAIDKYNEGMMVMFGAADQINRYATLKAARSWARDLASGNKDAVAALKKAGTGLKQDLAASGLIQKAATSQVDMANLEHTLAHYLNQKTQFLYGKEFQSKSLAEMGRHFSMFAKFPSIITSDVAYTASKRDLGRFAEKFGTPTAMLVLASYLVSAHETPELKYFVGNPLTAGPLGSLGGAERVMGGGPAVKTVVGAMKGLSDVSTAPSSEEIKQKAAQVVKRAAKGALKTYVPVASPIINEVDRWNKAHGKMKLSDKLLGGEE